MPYITAIFDRTQADINAKNSKAYLNLVDAQRINNNIFIVGDLFESALNQNRFQYTETDQTTATVPDKTSWLNYLTGHIESMRSWADTYLSAYITDPLFVEIKDDWGDGHQATAPNYTHVNSWEYVLDVLYNLLSTWTPPVISGDLLLLTDAISLSNTDLIG